MKKKKLLSLLIVSVFVFTGCGVAVSETPETTTQSTVETTK